MNNFIISSNTITGNSATIQGGGIDISGSVAEINGNTIRSNSAGSNGGGGMLVLGYVDVTGNTITGNTAYSGGGIIATTTGTIADNVITGNSARSGGDIRTVNPMGLTIQRNRVMDNHATNGDGGGMDLWGGFFMDITLDGDQVISNTATGKGGGIYIQGPGGDPEDDEPIDISNTVLAGNIDAAGSGLYSTVCELNLAYTMVASNRDPSDAWGDGRGLYLRLADETPSYNIVNSIVVDQAVGIYVESGSASIESTLWGSGTWANDTGGGGTIDIGTNNYYASPCLYQAGQQRLSYQQDITCRRQGGRHLDRDRHGWRFTPRSRSGYRCR